MKCLVSGGRQALNDAGNWPRRRLTMSDKATKVSSHDAVPSRPLSVVELLWISLRWQYMASRKDDR